MTAPDATRHLAGGGRGDGADAAILAAVRRLAAANPVERAGVLAALRVHQRDYLHDLWEAWAHDGQLAPAGDWRVWLIRAGRGFGKTRAGAEWVSEYARAHPGARIALVGANALDARAVMVEGPSGLVALARDDERPRWLSGKGELRWPNKASAFVYSADSPEGLRGPEHHVAWCDELAKWRRGEAWDNLMLGLRLADVARTVVTTTPRPTALMRRLMALPGLVETRGRTRDNLHLPPGFAEGMEALYGGTRLGRQELGGEMIDDVAGALWTRAMLEAARVDAAPDTVRVVVGVDPPSGGIRDDGAGGDACGIVAVALGVDGRGHVLSDASVADASPERWAAAVAACADAHGADRVVAEANQGGAMVRSVLRAAERTLPVTLVHASRGKSARAEPVAALYEGGRVRHVGCFPALEDEMCGLVAGGGYAGPGRSPDRADALVWALSELMLKPPAAARVRSLHAD